MSKEMAEQAVKVLTDNLRGSFPAKGMKDIWKELCGHPDKAISNAVDYLCLNSGGGYLPSPQKLLDRVRLEAKLIAAKESKDREDEWSRTKGGSTREELEKKGSIFSRDQNDEMGRNSVMMITGLISGKLSRQDFLDGFKAMDSLYPGIGWAKQGMLLQKEWAAKEMAA